MSGHDGYYEISNSNLLGNPEDNGNKTYSINFNTVDDGDCPTVAKIADITGGMWGARITKLYLGKLNLIHSTATFTPSGVFGMENLEVLELPRNVTRSNGNPSNMKGENCNKVHTLYLPENSTDLNSDALNGSAGTPKALTNVIIRNNSQYITLQSSQNPVLCLPKNWNPNEINLYFPTEELKNYYENLYQTGTETTWYKDSSNFAEGQTVNFLVGDEPVAPSYDDPAFSSFTAKNEKINIKPNTANNDGLELGSFNITNFSNIDPSALKLGTKITSWNASTAVQDSLKLEIADQGSGNYKVIAKWADNAFTTEEVISFQYEITNNDSKVVSSDETTYTITVINDTPVEPTTNNNLPAIIGGTVGGILALVIIAIIIAVVVKKRKQ